MKEEKVKLFWAAVITYCVGCIALAFFSPAIAIGVFFIGIAALFFTSLS